MIQMENEEKGQVETIATEVEWQADKRVQGT